MKLGEGAQAAGFKLSVFDTIGSTNDAGLAAASAGDSGLHWFVALAQDAGRGRSGRPWTSLRGNLFATLLLIEPCAAPDLPKLGFVAGVALHQAVSGLVPEPGVIRLKWPNDLLAAGAKLAGILLEGRALPGGRIAVAVGIGVNCAHAPADLPYAATSLAALGARPDATELFARLSDRMASVLTRFDRAAGFPALREAWLEAAYGLSGPIIVRIGAEQHEGIFAGIDENGRLLFDRMGQRQLIHAADVAFPAAENG